MVLRLMTLALLAGCGAEVGVNGKDASTEVCGNKIDDDDNGLVDCADPGCVSAECPEACGDGIDNNLDGLTDCDDYGCDGHCVEVCQDGRDNDGDGDKDCFDSECAYLCDVDGDGSFNFEVGGDDCDDGNREVFPGAVEVCDGFDNDCDGRLDDADPGLDMQSRLPWYADNDGDGYGTNQQPPAVACAPPPGRVATNDDCYDLDANRHPGAVEVCNDVDDDCDNLIDDMDPTLDTSTADLWYVDADGDGLGDPGVTTLACRQAPGLVLNADDCDDSSDFVLGASMWVLDADGDGFGNGIPVGPVSCTPPGPGYGPENVTDCDDVDPNVFPGAYETCGDLVDSDCDGFDCSEWGDDFEGGVLVDWTTSGAANWFVQGTTVHTGAFAAECGNINDSQDSNLAITLDFAAAGTVSFWHTGSTESNYDYLRFEVDGVLQFEQSGTWPWTSATYPISAGTHQLRWVYHKDGSVSTGADTVWIDDVLTTGALP